MARPTKLTQELRDKADYYVMTSGECAEDVVPSVVGLARYIGVSRSTVNKWGDEDEWFSDTLSSIQDDQHRKLVNGGLSGDYNAAITKLMMSNHGYSDKVENTHQGGDKPIETVSKNWFYEGVAPEAED